MSYRTFICMYCIAFAVCSYLIFGPDSTANYLWPSTSPWIPKSLVMLILLVISLGFLSIRRSIQEWMKNEEYLAKRIKPMPGRSR